MVIACSKCQTRFHVEDERIPEAGVRVRCSKCKHAFFVRPPRAPADAGVHAAAEAAAISGSASAPEPSLDLGGATEAPSAPAPSAPAEEEDDWQFAIDPPSAAADRSFAEPAEARADVSAPSLPERERRSGSAEEPETSSLADLESPESWNLLDGDTPGRAAAEPTVTAEYEPEDDDFAEAAYAEATAPARQPRVPSPGLGTAFRALGWIALVALLAVLGRGLLLAGRSAPTAGVGSTAVAGLQAREVRGRVVENARVGSLFVVTGTLANRDAAPRVPGSAIRVVLLDGDAKPLPGAVLAGRPLPPARVRTGEPGELRDALETSAGALARQALSPGEGVPFQAVFEGLDPAAVAFRLEDAPAPAPPPLPEAGTLEGGLEADAPPEAARSS